MKNVKISILGKIFTLFVLIYTLISCNINSNLDDENIIARVGDEYLYVSDIDKLLKENMSELDSTRAVNLYINRWAKRKVIFNKALLNLKDEETSFERLIDEYRESLITNAYRQKIVDQYLDTIISKEVILDFYNNNNDMFLLSTDLIIIKYADFPVNISNKAELLKLMKSNSIDDNKNLENFCYTFSTKFGVNDSTWIDLNQLRLNMPELKNISEYSLLKKDNFIEIQDSLNLYLARVLDVRKKHSVAPLPYIDNRVEAIILNKRKLELLRNIESKIFDDAINKREFEKY